MPDSGLMALFRPKHAVTPDNIYVVNDGLYIIFLYKCHMEIYELQYKQSSLS